MQVTVSSKYQVVIPKAVRKQLGIKPGQKVQVSQKNGTITIDTATSIIDKYAGSLTGVWGKDPDRYIRKLRDEWDEKIQDN